MNSRRLQRTIGLLGAVLTLSVAATPASAALVTVFNPSFEVDVEADGDYTPGTLSGWTINGNGGVWNPTTTHYPGEAPDGENVAYANTGTLSQELSATLEANMLYTLNVQVGNRTDTAFPGYSVGLYAGGMLLAEDANSLSPPDGTFELSTVTFATGSSHMMIGQPLEIRLMSSSVQTNFDAVQLTAVPEPAGMLLGTFALGMFGVMHRLRRRSPQLVC